MSLSTWLTDAQLQELLEKYFAGAYQEDPWAAELQKIIEEVQQKLLKRDVLDELTDEVLVEGLLAVYRRMVRVPMYYKAITTHPRQIRDALHYLLESGDDLATKANALLTSKGLYYIRGLGKSFWSVFLMAIDPAHNPYWNNRTEEALADLGMANWTPQTPPGQIYSRVAETHQALAALHPRATLYAVDHFMHYIMVLEGRTMLKQWQGEGKTQPASPEPDPLGEQIARWRAEYLPPERISTRQEAESEARELLAANVGQFDEETLRRFFELVNADFFSGQVRHNRFSPAFVGAYANRIVEQLDRFNEWSARLWQTPPAELEALLDTFWQQKPIAYAGISLPTLILYLRDPETYNLWLEPMANGLGHLTGFVAGSGSGMNYLKYNDAVNDLRRRFQLHPQEMDVILVHASRERTASFSEPSLPSSSTFRGFEADAFKFLAELVEHNSTEWMAANEERYRRVLREPLRALFKDVAPVMARLDPNLETDVKFGKVMATIKKRWPDEVGPYHTHLWGAFYQVGSTKQTDAQLFVIIHPTRLSVGIGAGKGAEEVLNRFRKNVKGYPEPFYRLLKPLLDQNVVITTFDAYGAEDHQTVTPASSAEVAHLADLGYIDIERHYQPTDSILYTPDFAVEVSNLFEALYPLYRFFTTDDLSAEVAKLLVDEEAEPGIEESETKYTFQQLQVDTFLDVETLSGLEKLLLDKGQIVLYGPPGAGKTYVAKRFARYFVDQTGGEIQIVQFHPSYAYEEFVEGIRPRSNDDGQLTYPIERGIFRRLCDDARNHPQHRYVLIIDEINRGNLPRIFGELLYLLEYRDDIEPVRLPYSRERFTIPRNVFLIGTMNTADRSIALIDHALRRRFHFIPLRPDPDILRAWLEAKDKEVMVWVADLLAEVNRRLEEDQIEWHLHIGHSHWMVRDGQLDEDRVKLIWEHSIKPTLEEYFYNRPDRLSRYDFNTLTSNLLSVD